MAHAETGSLISLHHTLMSSSLPFTSITHFILTIKGWSLNNMLYVYTISAVFSFFFFFQVFFLFFSFFFSYDVFYFGSFFFPFLRAGA